MTQVSESMLEIYNGKYGDLFKPTPKSLPKSANSRLIESFEKVNNFYRKNGFAPRKDSTDFKEQILGHQLLSLRNSPEKRKILNDFDEFSLLQLVEKPKTMAELFAMDDDAFGGEIFDTISLPRSERQVKNHAVVAKRRVMDGSSKNIFKEQQELLNEGKRKLKPFKSIEQLQVGKFYVYDGMMCYVSNQGEKEYKPGGYSQRRLRVLFENGTESNMYRRSLAQRLYEGGFEVVDEGLHPSAGYIYVLESLSQKDEIRTIKNFYKIGFTTNSVENRIKNAESDPTYLMSPVKIVSKYTVSNGIDPQKIEHVIHTFFSSAKVELLIIDNSGKKYAPDEWYSVSLEQIYKAIEILNSGDIINYYYDRGSGKIQKR
mgnify:FL=1